MKKHRFFVSKAVPGFLILSLSLGGCGGGGIYSASNMVAAETEAAMASGVDYDMGYDNIAAMAPVPMEEGFCISHAPFSSSISCSWYNF